MAGGRGNSKYKDCKMSMSIEDLGGKKQYGWNKMRGIKDGAEEVSEGQIMLKTLDLTLGVLGAF